MNRKSLIVVIALSVALIVFGVGIYFFFIKGDANDVNTNNDGVSSKLEEDKVFKKLKFTGHKFKHIKNNRYMVFVDVSNDTKKDIVLGQFQVVFKDKEGKELNILGVHSVDKIKAGETVQISFEMTMDASEVYELEYME